MEKYQCVIDTESVGRKIGRKRGRGREGTKEHQAPCYRIFEGKWLMCFVEYFSTLHYLLGRDGGRQREGGSWRWTLREPFQWELHPGQTLFNLLPCGPANPLCLDQPAQGWWYFSVNTVNNVNNEQKKRWCYLTLLCSGEVEVDKGRCLEKPFWYECDCVFGGCRNVHVFSTYLCACVCDRCNERGFNPNPLVVWIQGHCQMLTFSFPYICLIVSLLRDI